MTGATCVVLAGGLGTRLASELGGLPKCLAPVNGSPFIEILVEQLAGQGVSRFVLSLGHLAQKVLEAIAPMREHFAVDCVVEPAPLGTGGALLFAMHEAGLEEILAVNGDTFIDGDLAAMRRPLETSYNELARLAAVRVDDRARYGGLHIEGTCMRGFLEKGTGGEGLINSGFYRLHRRLFGTMAPGAAFSLERDILPGAVSRGVVTAIPLHGAFIDIGVPEDYRRFCATHV